MAQAPSIIFANLTCRFGEQMVLLDLAQQVVLPAFTDDSLRRKFGATSYFFLEVGFTDVSIEGVDEPQLTVYGRIVKDTVLTRNQIYSQDSGLIADEESIASAPSSFFALDLNNHKLIFLPETPYAPTVQVFASTFASFLNRKRNAYVRALHQEAINSSEPQTLEALFTRYPPAEVMATPMANSGTISDFLQSFEKLTHLEFRVLGTNAELSQQETFRSLLAMKENLASKKTKLVHSNSEGLNIKAATDEISASAAAGNQEVILAGTAADGTELRGSNDSFKLRVSADNVPEELLPRAAHLVREFFKQVSQGLLKPDQNEGDNEKVHLIRGKLDGLIERS